MTILTQLTWGTIFLGICAFMHVLVLSMGVPHLSRAGRFLDIRLPRLRIAGTLFLGVAMIVLAHTVQIWTWAAAYLYLGVLGTFEEAFYLATVTYTTLGYGDVVPGPENRIFAIFAAITGLLTFGISTAFLLGMVVRSGFL